MAPGAGLFKDDCSSHGHVRSRRYGTHRLVEVMNVPREVGVMSGKPMAGMESSAARVAPPSGGAVKGGGGGGRGGHSGAWAMRLVPAGGRWQRGPQDCGICWQRVGLGGSLAAALCSVRKLYSYCGGTDRQQSVCGARGGHSTPRPGPRRALCVHTGCGCEHVPADPPVGLPCPRVSEGWYLSQSLAHALKVRPQHPQCLSPDASSKHVPADRVPGCTPAPSASHPADGPTLARADLGLRPKPDQGQCSPQAQGTPTCRSAYVPLEHCSDGHTLPGPPPCGWPHELLRTL